MYDAIASLPLEIDDYVLEPHSLPVSSGFVRQTTVIRLRGGGLVGAGEEVSYEGPDQDAFQAAGPHQPLAGRWTFGDLSEHLDSLDLWPTPPTQAASVDYRRWAFESAALDLALRQAGRSLADVLGRPSHPLTFVCSTRLDDPPTPARLHAYRAAAPGLRFKLDPTPDWTADLIAELAALDAVDVVDLKGAYVGTPVDNPPCPDLYRRVAEGFPDRVWIEDPAVTDATRPVLEPHAARITWDAPIHSVADVEACPWPPRTINVKPSRSGPIARLFALYAYCEANDIGMYGGGQFELSVGRGQIQRLASIFHPDGGNDVAPLDYHAPDPPARLPTSPLELPDGPGFF